MKKTFSVYALILCLCTLLAAGCGSKDNTNSTTVAGNNGSETTAEAVVASDGYVFRLNGADIMPGMSQDDMIAAIGETDKVFDAPSCAGQGTDYTYTYGSVEITTVPNADGINEINSILLKDDMTATPEGVSLYMTMDDMTAAYGDGYTQSGNAYTYTKGNVSLQFIVENGEITSIQYAVTE